MPLRSRVLLLLRNTMPLAAGVLVMALLWVWVWPLSGPNHPKSAVASAAVAANGTSASGYWLVASDGGVFDYGDAVFHGSAGSLRLNKPIVGMASTADGGGYWLVASDGGVFDYGDAVFHGSAGSLRLNKPIVGMASTADGGGYWLVASDGGVFTYGDAGFRGSAGSLRLNKPIVGMAATADGGGYWLVASDGGVFTYGDAVFRGSAGSLRLNAPIVGMAATANGGGYWLVASDGGVFDYGDAGFYGSVGSIRLNKPIVGMAATADGGGYWLAASDGGVFTYGDAVFHGSAGSLRLNKPIVSMAATADGGGGPGGAVPTSAPVSWCETGLPTSPYSSPPPGAVVIPAGDDSGTPPAQSSTAQPNATYWFAPGIHHIGNNEFAQFEARSGDTFVGAPGAVIDGQGINDFAISGDLAADTSNVIVEYLTIEHFTAGSGAAVVGQDALDGWTIKDDLIENNPFGAGAAITSDGVVTDNCLTNNGEYGYTAEGENGTEHNATLTNNDISSNNKAGYYDVPGSTVQCGCSGGGKFWQTINATITGNYIHDNIGPGIWVDTANAGFNISHNYISDNWGEGVQYEISYNAQITDNTFVGNAWRGPDQRGPVLRRGGHLHLQLGRGRQGGVELRRGDPHLGQHLVAELGRDRPLPGLQPDLRILGRR